MPHSQIHEQTIPEDETGASPARSLSCRTTAGRSECRWQSGMPPAYAWRTPGGRVSPAASTLVVQDFHAQTSRRSAEFSAHEHLID